MPESSPRRTAAELRRLNTTDRADAILRAWVAGAPDGRRYLSAGVMALGERGEAYVSAFERSAGGVPRLVAAGYSRDGLLAAMVDLGARIEPALRSAETLPAPAGEPATVTIPAPPPTGLERCVTRYLDGLGGAIAGAEEAL